jgi:iron complex outermembrane receptor protein
MRLSWMSGVAVLAMAQSVWAADAPDDHLHAQEDSDIVVTAAVHQDRFGILAQTSVLTGAELARDLRPTIGETLARQPGVSATSFGPNASRPVLRGLQGDRVKILTDGIGSFDASATSVDHAVAINPLTADRIEVLRGPSALLFGPSAIGGVVNVVDSRIPRKVPDEFAHVDAMASYGTAANERSVSSRIDVPAGDKIVFHVDGTYTKSGDLDIGGHVLAPQQRAEAAASPDPEIAALADLKGTLPNSAGRTWDVAGGAAVITGTGNFGISVSRYDSLYGVPIRYALTPEGEAEKVQLDVKQTRVDARGEVQTGGGFLDSIRLRAGYADYKHAEIDDTGEVGTTFFNKSMEGRLEFIQAKQGPWSGTFGGGLFVRDFNVIGEEKFVPKNETMQLSAFTLQQIDLGDFRAEAAGRYEHATVRARADADLGNPAISRTFDAYSGSAGASYAFMEGWRIGANVSHTERIPTAEELYANGPHAGTQAFEIGDPTFTKEKSWGVEAVLRGDAGPLHIEASAYHNWFSNFIYEAETGAIEDGLPVFEMNQAKARLWGFELQGSAKLATIGGFGIVADASTDYTRATLTSLGPVPRIPPLRVLGGIEAQSDALTGRVEVEWDDKQNRVADVETTTKGFTLVNASASWKPMAGGPLTITAQANNLFDVVGRRHASFLKDYAPLAGRDFRVSARVSF